MNEEEFRKTISYAIDQIVEEKSKKGFLERLAAMTAFVAALGAFAGASVAIYSSWETIAKQEQIETTQAAIQKKQIELNEHQKKLDENARIGRLSITEKKYCASIPPDEDEAWTSYRKCLAELAVSNSPNDDHNRLICAAKYVPCKP
mgnify:CR=1 FL=1